MYATLFLIYTTSKNLALIQTTIKTLFLTHTQVTQNERFAIFYHTLFAFGCETQNAIIASVVFHTRKACNGHLSSKKYYKTSPNVHYNLLYKFSHNSLITFPLL